MSLFDCLGERNPVIISIPVQPGLRPAPQSHPATHRSLGLCGGLHARVIGVGTDVTHLDASLDLSRSKILDLAHCGAVASGGAEALHPGFVSFLLLKIKGERIDEAGDSSGEVLP